MMRMPGYLSVQILVLIALFSPGMAATAFFVSPTGADGNDGLSPATAFATLEQARDAMRTSATAKTVYLLGGTYLRTTSLRLTAADSGETWTSYPGQTAVIDGQNSVDIAIDIYNGDTTTSDNITIRRLTIQNTDKDGINAAYTRNLLIDSNTILNTASTDWNQAGIKTFGDFINGAITHNLIRNSNYCGIEGTSIAPFDISNFRIEYNIIIDAMLSVADGGGIYFMDRGHSGVPGRIANNIIGNEQPTADGSKALYLDDLISNITVENNITYGPYQYAIQYHGGDRNRVRNNIFDLTQTGIMALYGISDPTAGVFGMNGNTFTNNIVYSSAALPPTKLWDSYLVGTYPMAYPEVHDNQYWDLNGNLPNAGNILDSRPIVADPRFVDAAHHDYRFATAPSGTGFTPFDLGLAGPRPYIPPTITTQPTDRSAGVGQNTTFMVIAIGDPAPTFQWQRNGVDIAAATASSYTTAALSMADDSATFRCVVSNSAGSALLMSRAALLTMGTSASVGQGKNNGNGCGNGGIALIALGLALGLIRSLRRT